MSQFFSLVIAALYATLFQNLVLSASYGISETIKIAKRPKHLVMCSCSVGFYCTVAAIGAFFANKIEFIKTLPDVSLYFVYTLIIAAIYLVSGYFFVHVLKANKKFMNSLGMCAFNALVLSVPVLSFKMNAGIFESIGLGIGAAFAFLLSVLLINAGIRHIANNKNIPPIFRSTPALLIYVGILSLALSCLSGESLFI